ncbi:LysR substrate-binding domain-containing protein [Noviherbaspirillum denitrificans]|uniref:LysR substrate-binding domain-containing protein n=1 Tax=Noviherbaspirillum denitrificans TaxID=1968433 RepID=UPI001483B943|nr:LysR substrate-binding domain-containing protein [Noviherbaspirillum denitrificans]
MRRIPPLNAVKAFEAAGRLLSFTKAGQELNVTHGAVSRQVATLEEWLGVALFHRVNSQLILTEAGSLFLAEIGAALDKIALAAIQAANEVASVQLVVNAPPTFVLRWLIPRLATFQRKNLGVKLRLTTSVAPVDFSRGEYTVAIRGAVEPMPGIYSCAFLTERILPVCHPDLMEKFQFSSPEDLANQTLLSYSTEPYSWHDWFATVGAPDVRPAAMLNFEQMYFALQAAEEGLGLALIPYFMVVDEVAAGRLCTPFGVLGMRTRKYFANVKPGSTPNSAIDAFCNWLMQEGENTTALCDELLDPYLDTNADG